MSNKKIVAYSSNNDFDGHCQRCSSSDNISIVEIEGRNLTLQIRLCTRCLKTLHKEIGAHLALAKVT